MRHLVSYILWKVSLDLIHLYRFGSRADIHGTSGIDPAAYDLQAYLAIIRDRPEILINFFLPTPDSESWFIQAIKATICQVFRDHLPFGDKIPADLAKPTPVQQLDIEKPELHLLRLTDESDISPATYAHVIDRVCAQMGFDKDDFAGLVRVMESDGGKFSNLESLKDKRFPSGSTYGSLINYVCVLGASS